MDNKKIRKEYMIIVTGYLPMQRIVALLDNLKAAYKIIARWYDESGKVVQSDEWEQPEG